MFIYKYQSYPLLLYNLIKTFVEEVNSNIVLIVGLVSGIIYLAKQIQNLKKSLCDLNEKILEKKLNPIRDEITQLDINTTRNFLVRCISDFDNQIKVSEAVKITFWEQYDRYTAPKSKGGLEQNSYIKESVKRLIKENKISR